MNLSQFCISALFLLLAQQGAGHETSENGLVLESKSDLLEDTIRLLEEGDRLIVLDDHYTDIILTIGNTGAGKSTVVKFITDVSKLESYWAGDRYLIRDPEEGDISTNSTIISMSLFPQLFIHNETDTAFYDLPGFSDTRNSSVEIANAFFMKKVADHGKRVKLLFVVNYSSLRSGESRTDFVNMVKQAIDYVEDVGKFQAGIGLVATKVESIYDDERVIAGIVYFLETVKYDLAQLIPDEEERQHCTNLIDSLILKGNPTPDTEYSRIGLFRTPDEDGPLEQIASVMSGRPHMKQIIWDNTEYVPSSVGDFGLSLSPQAKLVVLDLTMRTNQDIEDTLIQLGADMDALFKFGNQPVLNLYKLVDHFNKKHRLFKLYMEKLGQSQNYTEFARVLDTLVQSLEVEHGDQTVNKVSRLVERLLFFDEVNGLISNQPPPTWFYPLNSSFRFLKGQSLSAGLQINDLLYSSTLTLSNTMTTLFRLKYNSNSYTIQSEMELERDHSQMAPYTTSLEQSGTFEQFYRQNHHQVLSTLSIDLPSSLLPQLPDPSQNLEVDIHPDILEGQPSPYKIQSWVKNLADVTRFLKNELDVLRGQPRSQIESDWVTNWGTWGGMSICPKGTFVGGMQVKTFPYQGVFGDDQAATGLKFFCSGADQSSSSPAAEVKSSDGRYGSWGGSYFCGGVGKAVGFQLRTQSDQGGGLDDSSTNNVRLICADGQVLEGDGLWFGDWKNQKRCPSGSFLCGIQTQIDVEGKGSDTGLNNVNAQCCNAFN